MDKQKHWVPRAWMNGTPTCCQYCSNPFPFDDKKIYAYRSHDTGKLYCDATCQGLAESPGEVVLQ